jgi:hypothetical protein
MPVKLALQEEAPLHFARGADFVGRTTRPTFIVPGGVYGQAESKTCVTIRARGNMFADNYVMRTYSVSLEYVGVFLK